MTKPRIKLLTLWVGELPPYYNSFKLRIKEVGVIGHQLIMLDEVEDVNRYVTETLGASCEKESGYALSDLRPMLATLFPLLVKYYEWWGWVELDVVLGDLNNLLPPLLDEYDAISAFPSTVSGPMMLLRNVERCNRLFDRGNWVEVLREPSYCNFEEVSGAHVAGFHKDGGFTKLLKESGLRTWWDDRSSTWDGHPAGVTPYGCRLEGNRLLETPTGRELMIYHFNHTKRWPLGEHK